MNFRCVKGFLGIGALFGSLFFGSGMVSASEVDTVTLEVPVSCTLTKTVNIVHEMAMRVGQYENDIGETAFNVICNDSEGFSIYAVGYSGDEYGNTTMVPTNNGITNAIATGTATSGDVSNWAMKLASVSGDYAPTLETGFNDYHVVPDTYTKVAEFPSNTDASSGSSFKSTYATYISTSQAADTYVGKVKFTVVHPANAEAPLRKSIDELTYMQDFKNLAAEDVAAVVLSMQYNTTYSLIDNRDNKTYQVAKLKDGNIWMAENLDLGRTTITQSLTSANTNIDANAASITASTFNSWIKTSGTLTNDEGVMVPIDGTDSTSNTPYGTLYNYCAASAGTICIGSYYYNSTNDICPAGWRLPIGGNSGEFNALYRSSGYNTATKMRAPITNGGAAFALAGAFDNSSPVHVGSGGFYWSSTVTNSSAMYRLTMDATYVIPANNNSRMGGSAVRCVAKKPRYLTVSYGVGVSDVRFNDVSVPDGETIKLEEGFSYSITMTPSPGYLFSSWSGESGIIGSTSSQTTTYTIGNSNATLTANAQYVTTEMQNLQSSNCTTTASYVRDNRDDHVYIIQRLADGKCWMMENLDLGRIRLTTDLTSLNTNLTDAITASTFNGWKKNSGTYKYISGEFVLVNGTDSTSKTPYGTLYNYCAASAGTICSPENSNSDNATNDICPAGWRLPTGGSSGEFQDLYDLTDYNTTNKMRASIANSGAAFALAGFFNDTTPKGQSSSGVYWSSTRYDGSNTYSLYLNSISTSPAKSTRRDGGFSMRCVSDI